MKWRKNVKRVPKQASHLKSTKATLRIAALNNGATKRGRGAGRANDQQKGTSLKFTRYEIEHFIAIPSIPTIAA